MCRVLHKAHIEAQVMNQLILDYVGFFSDSKDIHVQSVIKNIIYISLFAYIPPKRA